MRTRDQIEIETKNQKPLDKNERTCYNRVTIKTNIHLV